MAAINYMIELKRVILLVYESSYEIGSAPINIATGKWRISE